MKHHLDEVLLLLGLIAIIGMVIWAFSTLTNNKSYSTRPISKVTIGEVQIVPREQR